MPTVPTRCLPPGELERRPGELERRPMSLLMTEIAVAVSRLAEAGGVSPRPGAGPLAAPPRRAPRGAPHPVGDARLHPRVRHHVRRRAGPAPRPRAPAP